MSTFTITPRRKTFWIEKIDPDGVRTIVEQVATETEALKRLKLLENVSGRSAEFGKVGPCR